MVLAAVIAVGSVVGAVGFTGLIILIIRKLRSKENSCCGRSRCDQNAI